MPRIWFVHKYWRGAYRGCHRIKGTFEAADKFSAKLNRLYGNLGWGYEISATSDEPKH